MEEAALDRAEKECLEDSEVRARRRERAAIRRAELDEQYVEKFAGEVRRLFPGIPAKREQIIAEHACRKYSGRVGRSASAKEFDPESIELAVIAHIRHRETNYDELLGKGWDRREARRAVQAEVQRILKAWKQNN